MRPAIVSDDFLFFYTHAMDRDVGPFRFGLPCGEIYRQVLQPRSSARVSMSAAALETLRERYNARAGGTSDWQGTVGANYLSVADFSRLDGLYFADSESLRRALEAQFLAFARRRCMREPPQGLAGSFLVQSWGRTQRTVTVHREMCLIEATLFLAVNLRALTRDDEYDRLLDEARNALQPGAQEIVVIPGKVWRGGEYRDTDVVARRLPGGSTVVFCIEVGTARCAVQKSWRVSLEDKECPKGGRGVGAPAEADFGPPSAPPGGAAPLEIDGAPEDVAAPEGDGD